MAVKHSADPVQTDHELTDIANYVCDYQIADDAAYVSARICLLDALACGFAAVDHPHCAKLLGPIVPGATLKNGARVPGTRYELDPATAAFNIGTLIRWHDLNDTFTGASAIHPSDAAAGILAVADYLSRQQPAAALNMKDVLESLIKAYEIQGLIAMDNNSFGNEGYIDHVILTKVATAAVVTRLLGGGQHQVVNAVSNAWMEPTLRLYRHAPGAGSRKNWAAADASAQAVRLAYIARKGEMGYPIVLSAKKRGYYDAFRNGKPFVLSRSYGEYVIQNSMLKVVPSAMYGQSAAECAFRVHPLIAGRVNEIERIQIYTHSALLRIMDRTGPLHNVADRDHCAQYVVAIGLLFGRLRASDYEDEVAASPLVDALRDKMTMTEDPRFTQGFNDPARRSSATGLRIDFKDGTSTPRIDVEYPAGHPSRRAESAASFEAKLTDALDLRFSPGQCKRILYMCNEQTRFMETPVDEFMAALVK